MSPHLHAPELVGHRAKVFGNDKVKGNCSWHVEEILQQEEHRESPLLYTHMPYWMQCIIMFCDRCTRLKRDLHKCYISAEFEQALAHSNPPPPAVNWIDTMQENTCEAEADFPEVN